MSSTERQMNWGVRRSVNYWLYRQVERDVRKMVWLQASSQSEELTLAIVNQIADQIREDVLDGPVKIS